MIRSYEDLDVWKKAIELVVAVYSLTKEFPSEKRFGLVSQMRRAAVSIPSNIAEGYARRERQVEVILVDVQRMLNALVQALRQPKSLVPSP